MKFVEKVKDTILENYLIERGDSVLVALSGGPDSVALITALVKLKKKLGVEINAVYINHQIRPKAAKVEEKFCSTLCARHKVQLAIVSESIPKLAKKLKKSIEETGRDFRYAKLKQLGKDLDCNKIALGHHIDDRVETILFRLLRGTGRTGLKGIPLKRGAFIRPLYNVTKSEILNFLSTNKIKFCVDQSNCQIEYKRNLIRNKLLPQIRKEINSNVDSALLNLSEILAPEEDFLQSITKDAYEKVIRLTPAGKLIVALKQFSDYDLWVQRRLLRHCLTKASGSHSYPDKVTIDRILEIVNGKKKALSVSAGIQCHKIANELLIFKRRKLSFGKELKIPGNVLLEKVGVRMNAKRLEKVPANFKKNRRSTNVIVDLNKIKGKLRVRNIEKGDKFKPLGLKGSKKVGDYLTDRKVNAIVRDEIPVLADEQGIVWLAGFEIDERVKINGKTKEALSLELNYHDN